MWFLRNILPLTIFILCVLTMGASYIRFAYNHGYIAEYEISCDPESYNCFIGCEDDECAAEYYYAVMQKPANNLFLQCGKDITDCNLAQICLPEDEGKCDITYCDKTSPENNCTTQESYFDDNPAGMPDFVDVLNAETEDELIFEDNQTQYDL